MCCYFFDMGSLLSRYNASFCLIEYLISVLIRKPCCSFNCPCILQLYGIAGAVCTEERYVIRVSIIPSCICTFSQYTSMLVRALVATVKLLICDRKVMGSSHKSSLFAKSGRQLCTINDHLPILTKQGALCTGNCPFLLVCLYNLLTFFVLIIIFRASQRGICSWNDILCVASVSYNMG